MSKPVLSQSVRDVFAQLGASGGKARAARLTAAQRSAIAKKAARALWKQRRARAKSKPKSKPKSSAKRATKSQREQTSKSKTVLFRGPTMVFDRHPGPSRIQMVPAPASPDLMESLKRELSSAKPDDKS